MLCRSKLSQSRGLQEQLQQGFLPSDQLGNPKVETSSIQSPLMCNKIALKGKTGFNSASLARLVSETDHGAPLCLAEGAVPYANIDRDHWIIENTWYRVHQPLQPHEQSLDFLKHVNTCLVFVTKFTKWKPMSPSFFVVGTPSTKSSQGTTGTVDERTIGCSK